MNLLRKRRGVSGIISGVFLVAVAVMIFNVLAWQFFQQDAYNRIFQERQQREWERYNERLLILEVVPGTKLNFTVKNYGAVGAHIVDLFLTCLNNETHKYFSLDVWIGSGTTKQVVGPSIEQGLVYTFKIGTERGNVFAPAQQSMVNQQQPTGQQSVPFTLTFLADAFQFIKEGETWQNDRKSAWRIIEAKSKYVLFRLNITNTYTSDVILLSGSGMLLVTPDLDASTMKIGYRMYIVKEGSGLTQQGQKWMAEQFPFEGQTVPALKGRYVYFTARVENGTEATQLTSNAVDYNFQNYVSLFYKIKGDPYSTIFGATAAVIAMQVKTT